MDAAIQVVRAYLQANGYFTVTEYPIIEALEGGGYRAVTDIDILAVRLPGAGSIVWTQGESAAEESRAFEPDPRADRRAIGRATGLHHRRGQGGPGGAETAAAGGRTRSSRHFVGLHSSSPPVPRRSRTT